MPGSEIGDRGVMDRIGPTITTGGTFARDGSGCSRSTIVASSMRTRPSVGKVESSIAPATRGRAAPMAPGTAWASCSQTAGNRDRPHQAPQLERVSHGSLLATASSAELLNYDE